MSIHLANQDKDTDSIHENDDQDIEIQGMEDAPQESESQGMEDAPQESESQGMEDAPQDSDSEEMEQVYDLISVRNDLVLPSENLAIAHSADEQRSEQILGLRTELMMRRQFQDDTYMIAMLSPSAGDGRSQLAAELAIAFARLNRPTLLIDADLRNPQQHVLFNADNKYGLSQAIKSDGIPDLHSVKNFPQLVVMTAGEIPDNPLELLSSVRFARMIEYVRNNFEYVIIDTAPVTKYSDGLLIANLIRNVLTVSRAKHTSYRSMRDMLRRLRITNSQIVGGVINHF